MYAHIFFDELQDYAGWDLELLLLLFSSVIPITCVGDYKQATFRTNNSLKNKQFRDDKIKDFFESQQSKGICSITYSKVTRRFNQDMQVDVKSRKSYKYYFVLVETFRAV